MRVEDNLTAFFDALIKNRSNWKWVTDEQKEKNFFVINRFMSKKYPIYSQLLNDKLIDKVSAMDTWFWFMLDKPYPKWFWSKSEKEKQAISQSDKKVLIKALNINEQDLEYLIDNVPDFIKEELKLWKKREKLN